MSVYDKKDKQLSFFLLLEDLSCKLDNISQELSRLTHLSSDKNFKMKAGNGNMIRTEENNPVLL